MELQSKVPNNKVTLDIEYRRKRMKLQPGKPYTVTLKQIDGLKIKDNYLYYLKIKSDDYWSCFDEDTGGKDKRKLGVRIHIGLDY